MTPGPRLLGSLLLAALTAGCRQDMVDQPRYDPFQESPLFGDGAGSRPLPPNTIARGFLRLEKPLYTGKQNDQLISELPVRLDAALLARGRQRYDIYCSVCHSRIGDGRGMIVQRGFPPPPSFHIDRLRQVPIGHFYDVITNGYGLMYPYASRVNPEDRWAIAAYIRVLQSSQNAALADIPASARQTLEALPQ